MIQNVSLSKIALKFNRYLMLLYKQKLNLSFNYRI